MNKVSARTAFLTLGMSLVFIVVFAGRKSKAQDNHGQSAHLVKIKPKGYVPAPESKESLAGKALFENLNCAACHMIREAGGCLGPVLDGVGAVRSKEYMLARLSREESQVAKFNTLTEGASPDLMEHPRVSDKNARLLVAYLASLPEPPSGFVVVPHTTRLAAEPPVENPKFTPEVQSESSQKGAQLYKKLGCAACHSIANAGGWLGPSLDGVAGRHSRQYLEQHVSNARMHQERLGTNAEATPMPAFDIPQSDIDRICDFLSTLPNR